MLKQQDADLILIRDTIWTSITTIHGILDFLGTDKNMQACKDVYQHQRCEGNEPSGQQLKLTAALFKALGDPSRLALLYRIGDRERCVGELVASDEKLSTVSARLQTLLSANLVVRRRDSRHLYYRLADQHVVELIENALAHANETNVLKGD